MRVGFRSGSSHSAGVIVALKYNRAQLPMNPGGDTSARMRDRVKMPVRPRLHDAVLDAMMRDLINTPAPAPAQIPTPVPVVVAKLPANSARIVVRTGQSAQAFDGQIAISLAGIAYGGYPLRYRVLAIVGALGKESKSLDQVDVGFSITYNGFDVRLVSVEFSSATFTVTRLERK
jgi:hypothetical protein